MKSLATALTLVVLLAATAIGANMGSGDAFEVQSCRHTESFS